MEPRQIDATTPLLCAMLCLLNVDRRTKIPKDRMALTGSRWKRWPGATERETDWASVLELSERQRELALEELAYWLIRNDRSDATRAEVEVVVAEKLPQLAGKIDTWCSICYNGPPVVDRIDFIH